MIPTAIQVSTAINNEQQLLPALNPVIGYLKAADIAKKAYQQGRAILDVAAEETDLDRATLEALLDPKKLTQGGIAH